MCGTLGSQAPQKCTPGAVPSTFRPIIGDATLPESGSRCVAHVLSPCSRRTQHKSGTRGAKVDLLALPPRQAHALCGSSLVEDGAVLVAVWTGQSHADPRASTFGARYTAPNAQKRVVLVHGLREIGADFSKACCGWYRGDADDWELQMRRAGGARVSAWTNAVFERTSARGKPAHAPPTARRRLKRRHRHLRARRAHHFRPSAAGGEQWMGRVSLTEQAGSNSGVADLPLRLLRRSW